MEQQPNSGGNAQPHSPEQREHLRINTIIIPADEHQPLRQGEIGVTNAHEYQQAVGGFIEAVSLENPSSTLYYNEDGKRNDLPLNPRATMLLWAHQSALRFFDYIAGDALLVGPMNDDGDDIDVPDAFVQLLVEATAFRGEVRTRSGGGWYGIQLRFDRWTEAYGYVLQLAQNWAQIEGVRVMPDDYPTNS